jgi:hypothetical protein
MSSNLSLSVGVQEDNKRLTTIKSQSKMTVLSKFAEPVQNEPFNNYYFYGRCWHNALYNMMTAPQHAPVEGKPLSRLVAGSLETADGHGIWGTDGHNDPQAFLDDWAACHVWVEDGDGRIWDILSEQYNVVVGKRLKRAGKTTTVATPIPAGGIEIEGMTALEIEQTYGYRFIPAPANCQGHIFANCFSKWMPYRPYNFHTGKHYAEGWIGFGYKAPTMERQKQKTELFQRIHKFGEAITGTSHEAQMWWRTEVWGKPADTKYFHYHLSEMGEDMLTGTGLEPLVEVFANTGFCFADLGKYISKSINAYKDEPDLSDIIASFCENAPIRQIRSMVMGGLAVSEITLD